MKIHKLFLLVLVVPLVAFTTMHKFYVSVTNIEHNKAENALQITTRIFIDDFQRVLKERYDFNDELTIEKDVQKVEKLMHTYLAKKLKIWVNGELSTFNFIGKKYEDDVTICYLEIEGVENVNSLQVENSVLCELEEDQQNIVHVKIQDQRKSLLLVKENDKGLLKF